MKLIVAKKTNPAFKRPQALPRLPELSVRLAEIKKYAAAPAVVIVASDPETDPELKPESNLLCA